MASRVGGGRGARLGSWIAGAILMVTIAVSVIALAPPTILLDTWLTNVSAGRVRLAQVQGTLWQGSGRLVLVDPARLQIVEAAPRPLAGLALPGRVAWEISPRLLFGIFDARVTMLNGAEPLHVLGSVATGIRLGAGVLDWPGLELEGLGAPWNTVRPRARAHLSWEPMVIDSGGIRGTLALELSEVASALSPVRPLGSWRLAVQARGKDASLRMETLAGPVHLEGDGQWRAGAGLSLRLLAWPDNEYQAALSPLLNLIGPRESGRTLIRVGV